ncbi:MAG: Asp-tRNA(Asn)/Glu-tRNA(Gln) amidotransferase subunit GatB [Holosporaceae bacterium]|jgi:aspartyl-tRNA(Asn)/glutamyl-tRNA(Gln) amidotransferase subunit B|nr:Asp-tRNA(Asn)/Glu-tRNA(Gln) amidotransferase subunit GatB [Holosporaceae bacterium]
MSHQRTHSGCWEVVIGLEVHAQVISKSKLFSDASTKFGTYPNENVSFVDAALPGVLPVINSFCIDQTIKTGLGLNGTVNQTSFFDRKNYFYADLPQGYQITQFYHPIITGGYVEIETKDGNDKRINLDHIHMEQDAGKSIHDKSPTKSFIDLNRSGIALMEIVTKPDMRSAEEAAIFLRKLRSILRYLGTCDGNMDEGSMRADVNVSVHHPGTEYGPRVEVKNVNSVKFLMIAVNSEVKRQIKVLESGKTVEQETRQFDSDAGETWSMRSKENAQDYRYFPEPDLPPLWLEQSRIDAIRATIPELPDGIIFRLQRDYRLPHYDARLIASEKEIARFFEEALVDGTKSDKILVKMLSNWLVGDLFALLNKHGVTIEESRISPKSLMDLMILIKNEAISGKMAKDVLELMWKEQKTPGVIIEEKGWRQTTSAEEIGNSIRKILEIHADKVTEYKNGKEKLFGFFVGQVMKEMQGKANPQILNEVLLKLLKE